MSRRGRAGFTLLELTVSLAISALALASLTHLVHDAASLDARLSHRLRGAGEAESLFTLLGQLLGEPQHELSGEALKVAGGAGGPPVSGTGYEITIASRGPRVLGFSEPTKFTLGFEVGVASDKGRVLLSWPTATGIEQEVVTSARALHLRYAATDYRGEPVWTESWSQPVAALSLVEVGIVEAASGRRISRLIPVSWSLPRICVLQPLLEGCPQWR